ncbi:aldehyde dehydrogenase family protein [Gammaproteobacteria bacterium 42_54_T18]|nr:aldehyde dehydrogenase family protein [Gammaproteobacteria bacterium 42_54_T18]
MYDYRQFYINGDWVNPVNPQDFDVINPANEDVVAQISLGSAADVDKAVAAAKVAFEQYSQTTPEERIALLEKILAVYQTRMQEMAMLISEEMGAPIGLANMAQAPSAMGHIMNGIDTLKSYCFEKSVGTSKILKEPVGVCGLITPWNWPINQIACKVIPALAAGCTMVLKPSEVAPLDAYLFAKILDEAGVPKGVFNLVNGDGETVGNAITRHADIDMVSFTGSTRAGIAIAKNAADSVKRVTQELGGKSANIILDDADFTRAVAGGVIHCFNNSGQSCNAPTRMLVPRERMAEVIEVAKATAQTVVTGDPAAKETTMGPVASEVQFNKIQGLIKSGIDDGAELVVGGLGKPEGLECGYFVQPTIFANVTNDMTIAREEIFGPVLSILAYDSEDDAVRIANDTPYGLSGYVSSSDTDRAYKVARRLRTGNIHINGAAPDLRLPFGGYKQSGNGREWGDAGFEEYLETKVLLGVLK